MVPRFAIGHTRAVCNGWCKAAQELRRDIHSRTKYIITERVYIKITNKYTRCPNIFNHLFYYTHRNSCATSRNRSNGPSFQTCTPSTLSTTNSYLTSSVLVSFFAS